MSEPRAFCPSCKQDVVFQNTPAAAVCPACGASFDLVTETVRKKYLSWRDGVLFVLWIFVPSVIALIVALVLVNIKDGNTTQLDHILDGQAGTVLLPVMLLFAAANSYCASAWLAGRFTKKTGLRVLFGIFLGLAVLATNAFVSFFGGCALALTGYLR